MENTRSIASFTSDDRHPRAAITPGANLVGERLRLLATQAGMELAVVVLVLLGYMALFAQQLEGWGLLSGVPLVGVYLLRGLLARGFLSSDASVKDLNLWLKLFVLISTLSGIAWGLFVSVLMIYGNPGSMIYISLLIGVLTVAAILSLGALLRAYIGFTLGVLTPIASTLVLGNNSFDSNLAWVVVAYGVFLSFTAASFHLQLSHWLHLASENIELADRLYDLYDEQRSSEQAWSELEDRLAHLLRQIR